LQAAKEQVPKTRNLFGSMFLSSVIYKSWSI